MPESALSYVRGRAQRSIHLMDGLMEALTKTEPALVPIATLIHEDAAAAAAACQLHAEREWANSRRRILSEVYALSRMAGETSAPMAERIARMVCSR